MYGNYIPNGYLIRKNIFKTIGFFTTKAPLEDYWLMLQISKNGKLKFIDKNLLRYRWHDHNTVKNNKIMQSMTLKTFKYEIELIKASSNLSFYLEYLSSLHNKYKKILFDFGFIQLVKSRNDKYKYFQLSFLNTIFSLPYKRI